MQVSRPRNETPPKKGKRLLGSPGLPPRPRDPLGDALRLRTAALTPLATRFAARAALSSPSLLVLLVSASRRANFCRNFWLEMFISDLRSETGPCPDLEAKKNGEKA